MCRNLLMCALKFWIIFFEISKIETVSNESTSVSTINSTLPTLRTFSLFSERVTASPPEWRLFNPELENMEDYIKSSRKIRKYLASIKNEFKRFVIENQMKYCPYVNHCNVTVNAITDRMSCCEPCSCDRSCQTDKTCCPSVLNETEFVYDVNATIVFNGINMTSHDDGAEAEELVQPTCNLRHLTIRPSYEQKGFMAISDCPRHSDLELLYNCTRPYTDNMRMKDTLPAYSNNSVEIFRNKFCALCNGVDEKDILFFYSEISCANKDNLLTQITSEHDLVQLIFANEECDLQYGIQDERVKMKGCKYFITRCNVTASWKEYDIRLDLACNLYESKFRHNNYVFRNIFCALCNGITPQLVTCPIHNILATDIFSFSGLLNLDFDQGFSTTYLAQNRDNQGSSCGRNQLYDALTVSDRFFSAFFFMVIIKCYFAEKKV